tara:strand:- start:891 stop:8294 length:7404 start_codon:yes stop_codon:yes gene_type:complete
MPQKTNLNISPYYDDFSKDDNFYKVLFKPGLPVQARELTGLQSILQNQVENFGKHIFKEGSMVIPGGIEFDKSYYSAKINATHLGIDVSIYLSDIISNNNGKGTRVRGQNSGIVATIKNFILPPAEGVDEITVFLKYNQSGTDNESVAFPDGEVLILEEPLTYGNTTLSIDETVLTLTPENAAATGSAFGVNKGVYFLRGIFVDVPTSLIVLDPYNNQPSYRVGFEVIEEVVNANDNSKLYDNAKGFTNFAAPGADRFKITCKLAKKSLQDFNDTNFVELFRVREGETKKLQNMSVYSEIKKYFAKRTFDESGDYSVVPFRVNIQNSLNNEIDSRGLYTENQVTDEGNKPTDDLMCVKLSPGRAYVRGFDVYLPGTTVLDIEKPRDVKKVNAASIPFNMGSVLKVNNVFGSPFVSVGGDNTNTIKLFNRRRDGSTLSGGGIQIGQARVYSYGATDGVYSGATTQFDLHLYDIQTFTILQVAGTLEPTRQIGGSRVRGKTSGTVGFLFENAGSTHAKEMIVAETTGDFINGEEIIINEGQGSPNFSITKINKYTVDDIKSVSQDVSTILGSPALVSDFLADAVLYDKVLPNFSLTDQLNVLGGSGTNTANVPSRRFSGQIGINTDALIAYQFSTDADETVNRVSAISADGATLTLSATTTVSGVNNGAIKAAGISTSNSFRVKVPRISTNSGIFAPLPRKNIADVDTSNSNLIIGKQILNKAISSSTITLASSDALNASAGITSAFFEPFDAEKYSIQYSDGTTEPLTSDQVVITNGGNNIAFNGLSKSSGNATVNVTLKKIGITSKAKDYIRSEQVQITRTSKFNTLSGLTTSSNYGLRVEDEEISLNVPDVNKVIAIYESKTDNSPTFDKLKFVGGLNLNTDSIKGEKVIGQESRAIGQVVNRNANDVEIVYLNGNSFIVGEKVKFDESAIQSILQGIDTGNFVDRTNNFILNSGHTKEYCGLSRIVRKAKSAIPSRKLLVVYDQYQVSGDVTGDLFTASSYTKERFTDDIISVDRNRVTDILDFRPRVANYTVAGGVGSPFSLINRTFVANNPFIITPNESSILGFNFYLPRIDKLVINQFEEVKLIKGESAENPAPPTELGDSMEIAQISLPPYLYDPVRQPSIKLQDNRRFTMRDIGALEKRIDNLETLTTLNALELDTKSFQVRDGDGLDRFKSGFAVNNFKDRRFIDFTPETGSRIDVDIRKREMCNAVDFWSLRAELALNPQIAVATADLNSNLQLLDTNCQKTGDIITLAYTEVDWLNQPQATEVENINPFNVITFAGGIVLDPPSDNWSRTIYLDDERIESTGARWVEQSNIVNENITSTTDVQQFDTRRSRDDSGWVGFTATTTVNIDREIAFTNVLEGPSREFKYIEDVKVTSEADPFMRSRNVYFSVNGLKPLTRHFQYLDSAVPDIVPKLVEIEMVTGTFTIFENARIELNGEQIGYVRLQRPNHKFGDSQRPDIGSGLGSLAVLEENYEVDIYDRSRPAPSSSYSATSRLLNVDVTSLANLEEYFGYAIRNATIIGETSGAIATVTNINLISDNWGDIVGAFFFRDPNQTPQPPNVFRSGTITMRVTAASEGSIPIPGATDHASDASGTFTGTGTIVTQDTSTVDLRNPPAPPQRPNEFTNFTNTSTRTDRRWVEAPDRDPLSQTFTTDETGAFLTSFDVFFASKDPSAKVFVELRHVELGTPTRFLVQDYSQVALNPNQINTSADASVPTTIRFPSPVYLEPKREYAIVFLSPASDKYEMWVATMGQKTVRSTNLPDVENVIVSKQYLGGSLFKSQNGTIWTPSQFQDLCFKLRKASFVPSGTATFFNTPIEAGNLNTQVLPDNPLKSLPRKLKVVIDGSGTKTDAVFPIGRKVSTGAAADLEDQSVTGIIEGQGAPISTEEVVSGGGGYAFSNTTAVPVVSLTGSGTGATVNPTVSGGVVTAIAINAAGNGYQVGEVLTVDTTSSKYTRGSGLKFVVTAINSTFDTLYLTDVQGEKFTNNEVMVHYGANNNTRTVATNVAVNGDSTVNGAKFTGNVFEVTQFNHAHHSGLNQVDVKNIKPDTQIIQTTSSVTAEGTTVSVANTTPFVSYNGITTDRGEALFEDEIVSYVVGTGSLTLTRGKFNTIALPHPENADIQTYEASGISLVGINTTFTVSSHQDTIDSYFLEINTSNLAPTRTGNSLLCFKNEKAFGGKVARVSQNHQFSNATPQFNCITPGRTTRVNSSFRTISGTSADGVENSFVDQGFEPAILNQATFFPTPRLVASKINENARLATLPKNKSLTLNVNMSTQDPNLSPVLDTKNAIFILGRNKLNNPIGLANYASDDRTNQLKNDPHGSVFVSQRVDLQQPATSLKVLVGASVQPESDFRVYYRLFSSDSTEVSSTYRPFPGFVNLRDTNGDGFGDEIINVAENDGRSDAFVSPNRIGIFSEYQFTADNLEQFNSFTIKIVMSSTNESSQIKFKDFRAIALA